MTRRLLDVPESRRRLRVGNTKFYALLSSGELKSVKIGTRRLIPEEALDEYIKSLLDVAEGGDAA